MPPRGSGGSLTPLPPLGEGASAALGLWLRHPGLCLCLHVVPSLSLTRTLVIGFRDTWIIQNESISTARVTPAKSLSPNKFPPMSSGDWDVDMSIEPTMVTRSPTADAPNMPRMPASTGGRCRASCIPLSGHVSSRGPGSVREGQATSRRQGVCLQRIRNNKHD